MERSDIINGLAPISLTRGTNPLDITYEEAIEALRHPSWLSEDVNPDMAYMFLVQYKRRVGDLLASAIECINNDIKMIWYLEELMGKEGAPSISEYVKATEGIVQSLKTFKESL